MALNIETREVEGVTIVTLEGMLRLGDDTQRLRDTVREELERGHKSVLLHLNNLSYMDSAGLGALVACFTSTRNSGGALKLLQPSKKVRDQLHMTKLLPVFEIFEEESAAVSSFAGLPGAT